MKILIIGGGPAGIAAALAAKKTNNDVILLEKNSRIGKKLLATGNGRCNYSNEVMTPKEYNHPCFVEPLLSKFGTAELIQYFQMMGLESTHDGRRIYPVTLKSNSVLNTLLRELERRKIEIITDCFVTDMAKRDGQFHLQTTKGEMIADIVVFATGGASMPSSGSDGTSFSLLQHMGHHVSKLYPALTQLKLAGGEWRSLSGIKVQAKARLFHENEVIEERFGDLLFTNYGISGPPILDFSVYLSQYSQLTLEMPLINHAHESTADMLYNRYYMLEYLSLEEYLLGIVDKKIAYYLLKELSLPKELPVGNLSSRDFSRLVEKLLHCRFSIMGNTGFQNSQVTRGGVYTQEVSSEDFSSKMVENLYIVGEALDIDGICGGYNLHFAFGSGTIAGRAIYHRGENS